MHKFTDMFMIFIDYEIDLGFNAFCYLDNLGASSYELCLTNRFSVSINDYAFSNKHDLKLYSNEIKIDDA